MPFTSHGLERIELHVRASVAHQRALANVYDPIPCLSWRFFPVSSLVLLLSSFSFLSFFVLSLFFFFLSFFSRFSLSFCCAPGPSPVPTRRREDRRQAAARQLANSTASQENWEDRKGKKQKKRKERGKERRKRKQKRKKKEGKD